MTGSPTKAIDASLEDAPCPACGRPSKAVRIFDEFKPVRCGECRDPEPVADDEPRSDAETLAGLEAAGVNVNRYRDARLSSFDDTADPHALEAANEWIEGWYQDAKYPVRPWLYLYSSGSEIRSGNARPGTPGNGKTFLGVAIARYLIHTRKLHPASYMFITCGRLRLRARATFNATDGDSELRLLNRLGRCKLLHLDDLGVGRWTDYAIEILDEVAKEREGRATIWTSNYSPQVIAQQDPRLQRIVSRIAGECGPKYMVRFEGPDRRVGA